jgi:hypothetical protein
MGRASCCLPLRELAQRQGTQTPRAFSSGCHGGKCRSYLNTAVDPGQMTPSFQTSVPSSVKWMHMGTRVIYQTHRKFVQRAVCLLLTERDEGR